MQGTSIVHNTAITARHTPCACRRAITPLHTVAATPVSYRQPARAHTHAAGESLALTTLHAAAMSHHSRSPRNLLWRPVLCLAGLCFGSLWLFAAPHPRRTPAVTVTARAGFVHEPADVHIQQHQQQHQQQSATKRIPTYHMDDSISRVYVNMSTANVRLPDTFWRKRLGDDALTNPTKLAIIEQNPVELIIHGCSYDISYQAFRCQVFVEYSAHFYWHWSPYVHGITKAWHSDEFNADRDTQEALTQLMAAVRCAYEVDNAAVALDEQAVLRQATPVLGWEDKQYFIELLCGWPLAPMLPAASLALQLRAAAADEWVAVPIVKDAGEQHGWQSLHSQGVSAAGLCAEVKHNASMSHVFEWLNYHLAFGFCPIMLTDDTYEAVYRPLLQPYIDAGLVIHKHYPPAHPLEPRIDLYSQEVKMALCHSRLYHQTQWIAHWDTDEWLTPALAADVLQQQYVAHQQCIVLLPMTAQESAQHVAILQQYGIVRNLTEYPLQQAVVNPHLASGGTTRCRSIVQRLLQQHMTQTRTWDENLQYEAIILPRYDSTIRNHSAVHAYTQRTAATVSEQAMDGNHLYLPLTDLYPYKSATVDGNEPKFMARPRISGHLWIHKPLYRNSVHDRNQLLYQAPSTLMSLTHYVHQYSYRAHKDKGTDDAASYAINHPVNTLAALLRSSRR